MARRKPLDVSFGAKRVNPEDTLESGLPREMRNRPKGERRLAVKPSLLDYARTVSEVAQGIRPENIPMTGVRVGKQLGPAIGGGLSALYDYARSTAPGQVVSDVIGAPARLGASIRENPSMLYELIPGSGTVQGIREGAQRLAEGDPEAMRNAAALAAFAGAMDVIPGGGKGANLAVKGAKELAEEGVDLAARRAAGEALIGAESPFMISTRRPTPGRGGANFAVYGNPDERLLVQSGEALRASPAAFAKNMQMLSEEPFAARVAGKSPEEIYDYATEQGARNLEFITNELMPPEKVQAAREWYPVAKMVSERAAERSGFAPQVGYGVTAVTSPQAPWDINVAKMERLLDLYRGGFDANPEDVVAWARRRMEDPKRAGAVAPLGEDYLRRITETPISELPVGFDRYAKVVSADAALNDPMVRRVLLSGEYGEPYGPITWGSSNEINKALNILSDPSMINVAGQMEGGGKVPSFYNNIAAPFSASPIATIDTHSAGAYSLFPGGGKDPIVYRAMGLSGTPGAPGAADVAATGSKGLYGPVVEAHRLAGERLGFLPREVQSATWEGVRDLWGQSGKTAALKKDIADIWRTSSSLDEARFRIAERLGKPLRRVFKVR